MSNQKYSKVLIIPDVHGRPFWHYAKDHVDEYDKIIFLGDYLDPYSYEGITEERALDEFKDIIQFKKDNMDKVELLIGNHDESYIWLTPGYHDRHDYEREEEINKLFNDNYKLFRTAYLIDKYLFSHAGIYQEWLDTIHLKLEDILNSDISFWNGKFQFLDYVSYNRGGRDNVSSCVWADINDLQDINLVKGYYHIFGHTQMVSKPLINNLDEWACLDVRKPFVLDLETNKIEEIND